MKRLLFMFSIFALLAFVMPLMAQEKKPEAQEKTEAQETTDAKQLPLTDSHQKFLEIVYWIISDYEKSAFLSLKTNEDRERFIAAFWENRDPTPGTDKNEFREEHRARFEYATKQYGRDTSLPGWKTDRGKVYILLGKPNFIKRNPSPFELHPNELWQYAGYRGFGLPGSIYFLFFQENGVGTYRLYSPLQDGIKELFVQQSNVQGMTDEDLFDKLQLEIGDPDLAHAAFSSIPTEGGDPSQFINSGSISAEMIQAKLQNARNYDLPKRKYVESFIKDLPNVTVYTSLDSAGIYEDLFWFRGSNGNFYIDYGVEFEPDKLDMGQYIEEYYTSLSVDGSISSPDQKIELDEIVGAHEIKLTPDQFAKIQSIPFQYQGRRPIVPGKYGITLIMNNNVSRRSITFSHDVDIPDMATAKAPVFSPVVPVRAAERVQDNKKLRPFEYGETIYTPNLQSRFSQKGNMSFYHQVIFPDNYVGGLGALSLRYLVMNGDTVEKEITESLNLKSEELAGNAIDVIKDVPAIDLSFGDKKLVVELRQEDKVLARSQPASFLIQPEAVPVVWKFAVSIPNFDSPYHSYTLAQQFLRLNRPKDALVLLEEAFQQNPDSPEVRTQLMRVALKGKDYQRVIDLGTPAEVKNPRNKEMLWLLGWSYYGQQKYEDAVRFFERLRIEDPNKVEVFNLLADMYYRLDQKEKSLERIQQSLALKPDQKDIVELKKKVESN
jgi:GWxTD domain-containing protein